MDHIPSNQDAGELRAPRRPIPEWLDDASVEEFRKLYQEEFGEELSPGEARILISQLAELYFLIASQRHEGQEEDRES